MRDIRRKIKGDADLREAFAPKLALAERTYAQRAKQHGQKVCSLRAPEVECIGKGKVHKLYEFGAKVSVATPIQRCKGGQFVAHVAALPGNLYDGHALANMVPEFTRQIGVNLQRGVTDKIKRELRRRSAVESVIGHLKSDDRMHRNNLKGRTGDAANAILAAIG
jgi:IS5 family transposase